MEDAEHPESTQQSPRRSHAQDAAQQDDTTEDHEHRPPVRHATRTVMLGPRGQMTFTFGGQQAAVADPMMDFNAYDLTASLIARMLQGIFANAYGGEGAHQGEHHPLMHMFGMPAQGQLGDYVFGQRGLDDIISRLMEQTGGRVSYRRVR
jgi:hypothetical protein